MKGLLLSAGKVISSGIEEKILQQKLKTVVGGKVVETAVVEEKQFINQEAVAVVNKGNRNRFIPDANATGAHTVVRRDPVTGKVTHYETFRPQTNPYDPKPWESVVRFDSDVHFHSHFNKYFEQWIDTPHIHDPHYPGGVRYPEPLEIPYGK